MYESIERQEDTFSKIQTDVTYTHFKMSSSPEIMMYQQEIEKMWMPFKNELSENILYRLRLSVNEGLRWYR